MSTVRPLIRPALRAPLRAPVRSFERFEDGIHLDFRRGRHYVKAPGAQPSVAAFESLFTFTRASSATYRDRDGLLKTAANNIPRIEYDMDGNCLGLLMEGGRTNVQLYSEDFSNANWTQLNLGTVQTNAAMAPDGSVAAEKLVETNATGSHRTRPVDLTITSNGTYAMSVWVKAAERTFFSLRFTDTVLTNYCEAYFNLSTGAVIAANNFGSASGATGRIDVYANGWYRLSLAGAINGAITTGRFLYEINDAAQGFSYTGTTDYGLYVWGAQIEAAAFPSSYIPTTSASVTRGADTNTRTVGSEMSASAGTVFVQGRVGVSQDPSVGQFAWSIDDGTLNERFTLTRPPATDAARALVVDATVNQAILDGTFVNRAAFKSAMAWAINDFAHSFNGAAVLVDVSGTLPTVTQACVGCGSGPAQQFNAHVQRFDYWPERKSNTFLQAASV